MKRLLPTAPTKTYLALVKDLPRKHTSILTQLRTAHAPLAKHLHRIGKADSPICPNCRQHDETVLHYLLQCPAHQEARNTMREKTGSLSQDLTKLLSTPKALRALFQFIAETQRFHTTFGDLATLAET